VCILVTEESRRGRQLTQQRKYGHIGWSLPATFGYAPAAPTGALS
jgi:TPP-dependent 2-oxoacid decarboxylase